MVTHENRSIAIYLRIADTMYGDSYFFQSVLEVNEKNIYIQ